MGPKQGINYCEIIFFFFFFVKSLGRALSATAYPAGEMYEIRLTW